MRAIEINRFGGPEVLELASVSRPVPAPGQVLVRIAAAGINFADTLMREDRYAVTPTLPSVLGSEAVGTIVDGNGYAGWTVGQRLAVPLFALGQMGSYAEYVAVDAAMLVPVPEGVSDEVACALQVQGLSALALARHVPVQGKVVLVNAAAGGVGTLLVQLLKRAGARKIIAAASSAEKRALAISLGAGTAIDYTTADWLDRVKEASDGVGPDVIYESAGGKITSDSIQVLAARGALIIYGALNIQSFQLGVPELTQLIFKNQSIAGFALVPLLTPQSLKDDLTELFDLALRGLLRVQIGGRYPMARVGEAHQALTSRQSMGKLVLLTQVQ